MPDRIAELEAKVSALGDQLARLAGRLSALEAATGPAAPAPAADGQEAPAVPAPPVAAGLPPAADPFSGLLGLLPLGGRALLVLAGAFVLRALTDSGLTPGWLGLASGFAYALAFVALAGRAGAPASASVHGLSALTIAYPLLYESVAHFRLVSLTGATVALALVTSALLVVAHRRRLEALAWLATAGSIATVFALVLASGRWVPGVLFLVGLGVECLWFGYLFDWRALRWPVALVADLAALGLAVRAVSPYAVEGPRAAMAVEAVLLVLYLGSFAARTLLLHRGVVAFEVVQTVAVVSAGLGGAAVIAAHTDTSAAGFGAVAAVSGALAYAVAFAFRERRAQNRANFPFYGSVATLLVMSGTALALGRSSLAMIWSGLGVASALAARRLGRRSLATHAAVYAWGAALAAGLAALSIDALLAPVTRGWAPLHGVAMVALAAAGGCAWLVVTAGPGTGPAWSARVPRLALLLVVSFGAAGLAIAALVPPIAGVPGTEVSRGAAGAVRTTVLVVAALLLTWAGRREAWREASWLASAVLVATGLKILVEDLPAGRPATLIVSFGVYGAALLLVPRLRRRAPAAKAIGEEPPRAAAG